MNELRREWRHLGILVLLLLVILGVCVTSLHLHRKYNGPAFVPGVVAPPVAR